MSDFSTPTRISLDALKPKMEARGVVKRIELAGAFIDIGAEQDALLHISQIEPGNVKNVRDQLTEGQELTLWVMAVDPVSGRIAVTMFKPLAVEWKELREGQIYSGHVVRLEKFGVFVDIGAERPGLVHVSEMADDFVKSPGDVVKVGDEVQVKVIGVNRKKGQIDLSMKALASVEDAKEDEPEVPSLTSMAMAMKRAMEGAPSSMAKSAAARAAKNERRRAQQDDILKRTLENQIKQ